MESAILTGRRATPWPTPWPTPRVDSALTEGAARAGFGGAELLAGRARGMVDEVEFGKWWW